MPVNVVTQQLGLVTMERYGVSVRLSNQCFDAHATRFKYDIYNICKIYGSVAVHWINYPGGLCSRVKRYGHVTPPSWNA